MKTRESYLTFGVRNNSVGSRLSLSSQSNGEKGSTKSANGLSVWLVAVFIVGEVAGTGVLALPRAIADCDGWLGIILLFFLSGVAGYTGITLGWCWQLLEERYEEYRDTHVQDPYGEIGYRALGKLGSVLVAVSNNVSIFGGGVIFLILSAQMVEGLLKVPLPGVTFCEWLLVVAAVTVPLSWLGTPKDMWPVAIGAAVSTIFACILVLSNIIILIPKTAPLLEHGPTQVKRLFMAFGTLTFAYCGHSNFPTIQHDMKDAKKFSRAVVFAYAGLMCIFAPLTIAAYFVLGDLINDNILVTIDRLERTWIVYVVQTLFLCHLIFAFTVIVNPLAQGIEKFCNVKSEFGIGRMIWRALMIGMMLFVAESVPRFGPILSLIGGSTLNIIVFILPPVFYEMLCRGDGTFPKIPVPLHTRVIHIEIIIIGIIAGAASCYSAIDAIVSPGSFVPPCYLNMTAATES